MSYHYKYNRTLLKYAQQNKKESTEAEKLLWFKLRNRQLDGYKFRRQYPIHNYILDFYCVDKKFAIELDGSKHIEQRNYDDRRTKDLYTLGIKIIRFWDNEVLQNINGVLEQILTTLNKISKKEPHPTLS